LFHYGLVWNCWFRKTVMEIQLTYSQQNWRDLAEWLRSSCTGLTAATHTRAHYTHRPNAEIIINACRWSANSARCTGWLKIKYPTRQYAIFATSGQILKILEAV